jgi:hypothetical protein
MSSSMRCRSALTGRSTDETGIGCSSHDEGNSMLERQLCPAQGFIEYPLPHPQRQSREAGSCLGAKLSAPHCAECPVPGSANRSCYGGSSSTAAYGHPNGWTSASGPLRSPDPPFRFWPSPVVAVPCSNARSWLARGAYHSVAAQGRAASEHADDERADHTGATVKGGEAHE